ncbi:MAG: hypothetical protein JST04_13665 [Bdellovibrionales bacterium]|nr:hypothetical protein [Bdellovibrionales bacterium]
MKTGKTLRRQKAALHEALALKRAESNEAPVHFTPHQSRLSQEGRRNKPRHPSPKKTKRDRTADHVRAAEAREEMGALAPFSTPSGTLEGHPEIF